MLAGNSSAAGLEAGLASKAGLYAAGHSRRNFFSRGLGSAVVAAVLLGLVSLAAEAQSGKRPGPGHGVAGRARAMPAARHMATGRLTVTATVASSTAIMLFPDGSLRVVVANAPGGGSSTLLDFVPTSLFANAAGAPVLPARSEGAGSQPEAIMGAAAGVAAATEKSTANPNSSGGSRTVQSGPKAEPLRASRAETAE